LVGLGTPHFTHSACNVRLVASDRLCGVAVHVAGDVDGEQGRHRGKGQGDDSVPDLIKVQEQHLFHSAIHGFNELQDGTKTLRDLDFRNFTTLVLYVLKNEDGLPPRHTDPLHCKRKCIW
jgi:hypothetical protein